MRHDDSTGLDRALQERKVLAVAFLHLLDRDAIDLAKVVHPDPTYLLHHRVAALEIRPERCRG